MKRIILFIGIMISLLAIQTVLAQDTGIITYEVKQNMHRNIPKEREEMKAMIPEFRTSKQQLFFSAKESLYKPLIEDEEEDMVATNHGGGGGGITMRFQMPSEELYYSHDESKAITNREFNGKQYIINDSLVMQPWKFGTETKVILGYTCKQAFYTTTEEVRAMRMIMGGPGANSNSAPTPETQKVTREITAWYTDQIRPSLGPDKYYTLPGAVLAVDVNNGERVVVATKVDLRALKKNELKMPTKGEVVTQKQFRKMMEEQMQRMRQGGGGMMIRN